MKRSMSEKQFSCAIALFVFFSTPVFADDPHQTWPQWRGPTRNSNIAGPAWPESLQPPHLTRRWRVKLPPSFSGPIVSHDKVFVTETKDETYEVVRALDRNTGQEIWSAQWKSGMTVAPLGRSMGSWIRATPAYDGRHLYVAGMRDLLVCLDAKTGKIRWRADLHDRYKTPIPELGFVCSPLVLDDAVYVQAADSFLRLDKNTGQTVWRTLVQEELGHGSYSSPAFDTVLGVPQLLVAMIPDIAGIDPDTGRVLWIRRLEDNVAGCILAPIVYKDGIFTSTRQTHTGYYPLTYKNGTFTITDGWKNKAIAYMSSPVLRDNHVYMHLKNTRMTCIDLDTGKTKWTSREHFAKYCSMIARRDRILALGNNGRLFLLRATPEKLDVIDDRILTDDDTWGHLAISGNQLFIREKRAIAVYDWN